MNVNLEECTPSSVNYMNNKLSKKITKTSHLRNKFLNERSDLDRKAYNKQRNYIVSLLERVKANLMATLILTP